MEKKLALQLEVQVRLQVDTAAARTKVYLTNAAKCSLELTFDSHVLPNTASNFGTGSVEWQTGVHKLQQLCRQANNAIGGHIRAADALQDVFFRRGPCAHGDMFLIGPKVGSFKPHLLHNCSSSRWHCGHLQKFLVILPLSDSATVVSQSVCFCNNQTMELLLFSLCRTNHIHRPFNMSMHSSQISLFKYQISIAQQFV